MTVVDERDAIGPDTPVRICQLEAEFVPLLHVYREKAPKRVLEVGTAEGGTLYHWLTNAQPDTHVVSVDLEEPAYARDADLIESWVPPGVGLTLIAGDTHDEETQDLVAGFCPFDWVFIDGGHTYEDVKADVDAFVPMCAPGAFLVLHDIALVRTYEDGSRAGVWRVWRELQERGYWTREFRACRNAYGIGVVALP